MCLNDDVQKQDYVILIGQNKIAKIIHYLKNRKRVSNILLQLFNVLMVANSN